jgi:Ca2+-binding EF-hand superfamily protein
MTRQSLARLTVLSALGVLVQADARAQQVGPGGIDFQELFLSLDANNDQMIARGEVPESARPAFDRLVKLADKNGDGKIEREEYRDMLLRARDSAASGQAGRFAAMDKDGDGKVSRQEFQGPAPMFDRVDADKDGFITKAEVAAFRPGPGTPAQLAQRIKSMDKNGDGKTTREEFTGFGPNFERADTNKDGVVDADELKRLESSPAPAPEKK